MSFVRNTKLLAPLALFVGAALVYAPQTQAFGPGNSPAPVDRPAAIMVQVKTEAGGEQAEEFVRSLGNEAVGFLGNESLSMEQKQAQFRDLLNEKFDMSTIGRFTIGTNWRTLSDEQKKEYQALFEDLIVGIYSSKFSSYNGETLEIEGSQKRDEQDYIVQSHIMTPEGQKIPVGWQVRQKDGQQKIIDVTVEGVSMAITKRSEFASIIQRGGGDPEALLTYLRDQG